jgi:hypothetical protein
MTITIDPKLEARLREKAEAEGLTVSAYIERLVHADQAAEDELEALALEGLNSGDFIAVGPGFWEKVHRELDERLKRTGTRCRRASTLFVPRRVRIFAIRLSTTQPKQTRR